MSDHNRLYGAQVDRRCALPYTEFVNDYLKRSRPVIITDAVRNWKALSRWTPDFFGRSYRDREVHIDGMSYKVGEFIDLVNHSTVDQPAPYLRNEAVNEVFPEVTADIDPCHVYASPNWLAGRFYPARLNSMLNRCSVAELYIGGKGGAFPFLHYDLFHTNAYLSQIYGRKEYTVFSPDQTQYLYVVPGMPNQSSVSDLENPDLSRFPLFAKAKAARFCLEPGETLFIPAGWWHTARMLTPCITVSINHANSANWREVVSDLGSRFAQAESTATRLTAPAVSFYLSGVGVIRSLARS